MKAQSQKGVFQARASLNFLSPVSEVHSIFSSRGLPSASKRVMAIASVALSFSWTVLANNLHGGF